MVYIPKGNAAAPEKQPKTTQNQPKNNLNVNVNENGNDNYKLPFSLTKEKDELPSAANTPQKRIRRDRVNAWTMQKPHTLYSVR